MMETKTKQQLSKELNGLLHLSVDWSRLRSRDLQEVYRALVDEMTLAKALDMNRSSFTRKLHSMPLIKLMREQAQTIKRDYQRSHPETVTYHQQAGIPVLQAQKDFNLPTQPEKQKRIQYIS